MTARCDQQSVSCSPQTPARATAYACERLRMRRAPRTPRNWSTERRPAARADAQRRAGPRIRQAPWSHIQPGGPGRGARVPAGSTATGADSTQWTVPGPGCGGRTRLLQRVPNLRSGPWGRAVRFPAVVPSRAVAAAGKASRRGSEGCRGGAATRRLRRFARQAPAEWPARAGFGATVRVRGVTLFSVKFAKNT